MMDKKQQQIIEGFYKDFFSWKADHVGMWLVTGIMEFCVGILLWMPYQEMKDFNMPLLVMIGTMAIVYYLMPYIQFREGDKTCRVYDKLKYLPISLQQLRIYRLRKLTRFCFRVQIIFLAGQLFFSLVVFHEITWGNIWYPIVCGFLFPFGIGGSICLFAEK